MLEELKHKEDLNTNIFYLKGVVDVLEIMETSDLKKSKKIFLIDSLKIIQFNGPFRVLNMTMVWTK